MTLFSDPIEGFDGNSISAFLSDLTIRFDFEDCDCFWFPFLVELEGAP